MIVMIVRKSRAQVSYVIGTGHDSLLEGSSDGKGSWFRHISHEELLLDPQSQSLVCENCVLGGRPFNPWTSHLSHPSNWSHLFRTIWTWIWTTIRAAARVPRPIMKTSQQYLHLRASTRVPIQRSLKAPDNAIPFCVNFNYLYPK